MSDYLYAIIPYKKKGTFVADEGEVYISYPKIPELKGVKSKLAERDGLLLFPEFLMINTCHRQSSFVEWEDGYSWLRAEVYKIAKALGANEVWYAAELSTDEMYSKRISFRKWLESFKTGERYVCELCIEVLKDKYISTYYHDNFADIILKKPT